MQYAFTDAPIISRRIDRRTPKQRRIVAERWQKKFDELSSLYSVAEMQQMGFYNTPEHKLPYGIEVWHRHCTLRDKSSNWEWYELKVATVALCLPRMERLQAVERFSPMYWEDSRTYYWGFKQTYGKVVLWCIFDLLNRLLDLPHWHNIDRIPLRWIAGNENARAIASKQIELINLGEFALESPKLRDKDLHLPLHKLRHDCTPYDYEWQTGKRSRDEAQRFWNEAIKNQHG